MWWFMLLILTHRRKRQEDLCEFQVKLVYIWREGLGLPSDVVRTYLKRRRRGRKRKEKP